MTGNKVSEGIPVMRKVVLLFVVLLLVAGSVVFLETDQTVARANPAQLGSSRPELDYLKAVNSVAPPKDPQLLFLLMGAYSNANQQTDGAEFLSPRLNTFSPRLSAPQRALYLSALERFPPQHASSSSLLHR